MNKQISFTAFLSLVLLLVTGCNNTKRVAEEATESLSHGNYRSALKTLLELNDKTLENNDSVFLLLSEAYFGLTGSSEGLGGNSICDLDITPDGKAVLFTDLKNGRILEHGLPDMKFKRVVELESPVYGIDISPDGSKFAVALSNSNIDIYDYNSGNVVKSLKGHTNRARSVVFTDSAHLVSGGNDQNIITWDLLQGKSVDNRWSHRKNIKSLVKSHNGNFVVSASNDGTAVIWDFSDVNQGKEFQKLTHGQNYVNDVAFSPDDELLVTVSGDGDAKVWSVYSGILKETIPLNESVGSVDYSPDGKYIAIGGSRYVHIINTDTWKVEEKYPIANDPVWGLKFLDNGKLLFVDSSHLYSLDILSRKQLIEAARNWLKEHDK